MGIQTVSQAFGNEGGTISFRNRVINGDFSINQRGNTSSQIRANTTNPASFRMADCWYHGSDSFASGASPGAYTRSYEVINGVTWGKVTCDAPYNAVNYPGYVCRPFVYVIEDRDCRDFAGNYVTVSFLWRASTNGQYSLAIGDASDSRFTIYSWNYTGAATNSPQKVVITLKVPSEFLNAWGQNAVGRGFEMYFSYGVDNSNTLMSNDTNLNGTFAPTDGSRAMLTRTTDYKWWQNAGSWVAMTQLQCELGPNATAFEKRPYALELQLCKRYLEVFRNSGPAAGTDRYAVGSAFSSALIISISEKRYPPSTWISNTSFVEIRSGTNQAHTIGTIYTSNTSVQLLTGDSINLANSAGTIRISQTGEFIAFSSEV